MDKKELVKTVTKYEMAISFLKGLLNDGKLKENEYKKAAEHVAKQYDIEAVQLELGKLKYHMESNVFERQSGLTFISLPSNQDIKFISVTDIAKKFTDTSPSYVIQSWMRSSNTIEFLNLWEQRHNENYSVEGYERLLTKLKDGTFTMTPKQWIEQTKAVGLTSKSGKNGGTYAYPLLACEFMMWINPEYKLNLLELLSATYNTLTIKEIN